MINKPSLYKFQLVSQCLIWKFHLIWIGICKDIHQIVEHSIQFSWNVLHKLQFHWQNKTRNAAKFLNSNWNGNAYKKWTNEINYVNTVKSDKRNWQIKVLKYFVRLSTQKSDKNIDSIESTSASSWPWMQLR